MGLRAGRAAIIPQELTHDCCQVAVDFSLHSAGLTFIAGGLWQNTSCSPEQDFSLVG